MQGTSSAPKVERPVPTSNPPRVPLYFQQPQVQAQLRAQRGSINQEPPAAPNSSRGHRLDPPHPRASGSASTTAPQPTYSPYPFPASEHPLPPRTSSPRRRPLPPHLAIPDYTTPPPPGPPQYWQQQYQSRFFSPSASTQYPAQSQFQSNEYRFPAVSNPTVGGPSFAQYPSLPQNPFQVPPHSITSHPTQNYYGSGGGGRGLGGFAAQMLTPYPPMPIRHLDGPFPRQQYPYSGETFGILSSQLPEVVTGANFLPHPQPVYSPRCLPPGLPLPKHYGALYGSKATSSKSPSPGRSCQTPIELGGSASTENPSLPASASRTYDQQPSQLHDSIVSPTNDNDTPRQLPSPPASSSHSPHLENPHSLPSSPPTAPLHLHHHRNVSSSAHLDYTLPRAPGGITPALPPAILASLRLPHLAREPFSSTSSTSPLNNSDEHPGSTPTMTDSPLLQCCQVEGCRFPRFCTLSPCGDMICRDHLGSVIRGVRLEPKIKKTNKNVRTSTRGGRGRGEEEEGRGNETTKEEEEVDDDDDDKVEEMVRVFECVKCRKRSEMVGPTPQQQQFCVTRNQVSTASILVPPARTVQDTELGTGPEGGGGEAENSVRSEEGKRQTESFSIHYFSNGPSGGSGYYQTTHGRGGGGGGGRNQEDADREEPNESIESCQTDSNVVDHGPAVLVQKPPSPPYPLVYYPLPMTAMSGTMYDAEQSRAGESEQMINYYETSFDDSTSMSEPSLGEQLDLPLEGPEDNPVELVEAQSVVPLLPSPPRSRARQLPHPSPPCPPSPIHHHASLEDAIHLAQEDSSIVSVSSSPPSTPVRQLGFPSLNPVTEFDSPLSSAYDEPSLPSPAPTSEYFANYSFSPSFSPLSSPSRGSSRGRGGNRGYRGGGSNRGSPSRGRGGRGRYDTLVHGPWKSPPPAPHSRRRRSSLSTAIIFEEEEQDQGGGERPSIVEVVVPPETQVANWVSKSVNPELKGRFLVVKVENIPFRVTYRQVEAWLPLSVLPRFEECSQPIHIILHRTSGRTLPHCYVEVKDEGSAKLLLTEYDRSVLGGRTVRVKMERVGEFMRDLFDQSLYFTRREPGITNPALAALPPFPQDGYELPRTRILDEVQIEALNEWFFLPPWSAYGPMTAERGYTTLASIISRLPWETRSDLWDETLRDSLFALACRAIRLAKELRGFQADDFGPIADRLVEIVANCPGFTKEQRDQYSFFKTDDFPPLSSSSAVLHFTSDSPSVRSPPATSSAELALGPPIELASQSLSFGAHMGDSDIGVDSDSDWMRRNRTSSTIPEPTNVPQSPEIESPSVVYWASDPSPTKASGSVPPPSNPPRVPSVSIPRSSWIDASALPTTPIDQSLPPSTLDWSTEYPLTPPDSPENTRPRFSNRGRRRGWKTWSPSTTD